MNYSQVDIPIKPQNTASKILHLKDSLNNLNDSLDSSKNLFKGQTVLIVSAGPSSKYWEKVYARLLKETGEDVVVFCVKSAIELVKDLCHFHFVNDYNLKKFPAKLSPNCIRIMTRDSENTAVFGKYDIEFTVMGKLRADKKHVAATTSFDAYTIENTGHYRPPGPGIMHASVIYMAVHLGAKKIVTVGWDIADDNGANTHYYDNKQLNVDNNDGKRKNQKKKLKKILMQIGIFNVAILIKKAAYLTLNFIHFNLGKIINPTFMVPGEASLVASSIPDLKSWLSKIGIELEIVSDSIWMQTFQKSKSYDCGIQNGE